MKNPDVRVEVVDLSKDRIAAWNSSQLPLFEPGLPEAVREARDGSATRKPNLFFSCDVHGAIKRADLIFICVNTPTKEIGTGAGRAYDLAYFEGATRMIAAEADTDKIVVEKSTVPCRTAQSVREILYTTGKPGVNFEILSNPEFLAEGTAVNDLQNPDRVLVGSMQTASGLAAAKVLVDLYATWVPREKILPMNIWSSELTKLAANAILAQRISSINALSAICEATGADVSEVAHACGIDRRIGPKFLQASIGFGGSCFRKDVLSLSYMAECLHLPEVSAYWQSVVDINEWQKSRFTRRIMNRLHNSLRGKKIAILGFAYKKNTSDTRESAAISVVEELIAERALVRIYDPQVSKQQIREDMLARQVSTDDFEKYVSIHNSAYEAADDAHATVILTEWDEFSNIGPEPVVVKTENIADGDRLDSPLSLEVPLLDDRLDVANARIEWNRKDSYTAPTPNPHNLGVSNGRVNWAEIARLMKRPSFVFDGRRIMDASKLEKLGFRVECIGRASNSFTL